MKRKNIILAMLPIILAIIVLQSCTKEDSATYTIYNAFTEPTVVAPIDGTTLKLTGTTTTVDLKWATTNADNASPLADVYFGTTAVPPLYKSSVGALQLNVPVAIGKTYYWYVVMRDTHGVMTTSPTWSFTIFDPLAIFVGNYNVDEPAEGWSYAVSFIKASSTTLHIGNGAGSYDGWWASWGATFTLDLTANTYTMAKTDFGGGYAGQESGTIDQTTGEMVGTYTVWQTKSGVTKIIEEGVHTYTKK